jgi:hypothetical protein
MIALTFIFYLLFLLFNFFNIFITLKEKNKLQTCKAIMVEGDLNAPLQVHSRPDKRVAGLASVVEPHELCGCPFFWSLKDRSPTMAVRKYIVALRCFSGYQKNVG